MQPYPDRLLDEVTGIDREPDAAAVDRETVALAFVVALQVLPPRQRAVLIARDVLGWPAADAAATLEVSVAAANSALQRARATLRDHLPARRSDWTPRGLTDEERDVLERYMDAHERCDAAACLAIAAEDIRVTMPPYPWLYEGIAGATELLERGFGEGREGDWRLVPTSANGQPASGTYLRRWGDTEFRAFKLDVLRVEGGRLKEITTFGWSRFEGFGLPEILPPR